MAYVRGRMLVWAILAGALGLSCRGAPGTPLADYDITPGDMRARISFLASDRLQGRGTPSRGLDIAASYVESEFRRLGLESPAGGYTQRYQLVRTEMGSGWSLALQRGNQRATLDHRTDFWGLPWAAGTVEGRLRFVGTDAGGVIESDEPTIWVARLTTNMMPREWQRAASAAGAVGLLLVTAPDMLEPQARHWLSEGETVYELGDLEVSLPAALVSEEALSAAMQQIGLEVPPADPHDGGIAAGARLRLSADLRVETLSAPNVLGILQGSDRRLRKEYVLVSAHLDALGVGYPVDDDSIYNGADDNASGVAAVLEVAEAMMAAGRPPKRSLAFLAVSGEELGLLGSAWFVEHPPIPLDKIVANLNIDMVGRNWEDTIAVIGKPYSSLGMLVDSVTAAHPDLGLATVDDPWPADGFFFGSDHFNFARKGIPAVFFFNGVHEDYHRPSDEVSKIKFEKASRIARLIYEVARTVANADDPPHWDPEARSRIVEGAR
ncbi:MAG: M20/M25/M40 family metallo-hydrolase [Gemmatimonadota bacterium]|nr:MAG: M20/M25/M40 family metallo-hydrolase [Gemmatimonadota bacterium]